MKEIRVGGDLNSCSPMFYDGRSLTGLSYYVHRAAPNSSEAGGRFGLSVVFGPRSLEGLYSYKYCYEYCYIYLSMLYIYMCVFTGVH